MPKAPLHITHVVRQFFPMIGGLEEVVRRLAAEQVRSGHSVRVVTLDRLFTTNERLPRLDALDGVEVVRIPYRGSSRYPVAPGVLRELRDADLVHVHAVDFFFDFLAWTKPVHRKPLVATTHGGFFHTADLAALKRVWFSTLTRASSGFYDAVVACSASDEALFRSLHLRRLVRIDNGVAVDRFAGAASPVPRKGAVAIGRFSANKRLDRLLDAFAVLHGRDPEWRLAILGAASDLGAGDLRRMAAERGVAGSIEVVENASDRDIARVMAVSSLYASASEYEGFGLTLVEAMSAGLLPVVHANEAFRAFEAQHGCLCLTDFARADDAADAVQAAWRGRLEGGAAPGEAAKAVADGFAWPAVASRYAQVYADALARRG